MKNNGKSFSYILLASLFMISGVSACSKRHQDLPVFSALPLRDVENQSVGRFKTSYMADQIHAYFRGNLNGPIAVTTFVDIDNLYESSTFGRLLGEQMMSELSMRGYNVIELRQSEAMQVSYDQGEFALSRDTNILRRNQNVGAIVVGTYAVSPVRVYLNTRILDPKNAMITSVGSVEMSKTKEMDRLLRTNNFPQALERIPVRHLGYSVFPNSPGYMPYGSQLLVPSYPGWGIYPAPQEESDEVRTPAAPNAKSSAPVEAPLPKLEPTS